MIFKKTEKQAQLTRVLASSSKFDMAYGGSRSGKTTELVGAIIVRACKVKSRHVILRLKFNHAKTSIWLDTLPKVLKMRFPDLPVVWNKSDYYITLPNGSEIWVGGLDDSERVEKILGKEYSTMYFNEVSQIPWSSIQIALTRLAEKNDLRKKAYFDMNPPTKRHWSYWLWIEGKHPVTMGPVNREQYASLLMNPEDNLENIDEGYLELLESLDDEQKARFLLGKFAEAGAGNAYYAFDRITNTGVLDQALRIGTKMIGLDFNVNPMCGVIGYYINNVFYVTDELFEENSDTPRACDKLIRNGHAGANIYPDSTGKNRKTSGQSDFAILQQNGFNIQRTFNPFVKDRINNVNRLLRDGRIIIDPKCKKLIEDLEKVEWDGNDLDKKSDPMLTHISDALGYWCWAIEPLRMPTKQSSTTLL